MVQYTNTFCSNIWGCYHQLIEMLFRLKWIFFMFWFKQTDSFGSQVFGQTETNNSSVLVQLRTDFILDEITDPGHKD